MRHVCAVVLAVAVRGHVMPRVFVNWPNVLARFVSRSITSRGVSRVVLSQAFVVCSGVRFVRFTILSPQLPNGPARDCPGSTGCSFTSLTELVVLGSAS